MSGCDIMRLSMCAITTHILININDRDGLPVSAPAPSLPPPLPPSLPPIQHLGYKWIIHTYQFYHSQAEPEPDKQGGEEEGGKASEGRALGARTASEFYDD